MSSSSSVESAPPALVSFPALAAPTYKAYKLRWYILIVYSLAGLMQGYLWNMWGPIYPAMKTLEGWGSTQMALLPFYGTLMFVIFVMPSALMLERIGIRKTLILMIMCIMVSNLIRCVPCGGTCTTVLANISAVVNGLPGVVTFFLPAVISARWFPQAERKVATALGTLLNTLGVAGSFLIGPVLVPQESDADAIHEGLMVYTWGETLLSVALFVLICLYYPEEPPTPPSSSAETPRVDYWPGIKALLVNREFWVVSAPMVLVFGSYSSWIPVLSLDLADLNIDQSHAGYIGFWGSLAGMFFGIGAGALGDATGHLKAIMLACIALAVISSGWLVLVAHEFIPFSLRQMYIAAVILSVAASAILPINMELAAEILYPVDEAVVVGLLGMLSNVLNCAFFAVLFFKAAGHAWVDFFLVAACATAFPIALTIKAVYRRTAVDLDLDEAHKSRESSEVE